MQRNDPRSGLPRGAVYEGVECYRGHTLRYTSSRQCVACAKQRAMAQWADRKAARGR
jgi:hypothetical protein